MAEKYDRNKKIIEKLSTQLGLLGSRLSRIELKVMNSRLLPETHMCNKCDTDSVYGVGVLCSNCGKFDIIQEGKKNS